MKVADLDVDPRIAAILKEQGIEDLYPPQERAAPIALEGKSLVLAIPTASGKSLVAYLAVLKHVLNGGKAMYIVPLRALAAEKYDDLRAFEKLGIKVGISMGDYDSPDPTLGRYDVIVSTSERADSLLRHRADWLTKLTVVVADEVHLINDADRGPTLEVTLAKMRQVNPRLQIIALSATIRNSAELAAWLKAEHVQSDWRPVPLKAGVMFNGFVTWTDHSTTEFKANEDDLSGLVEDIIDTGGQALIFVNTRRSTEALAKSLTASVKLKGKDAVALKKLSDEVVREQEESTSMSNRLARCIQGGTAFHNAGLLNSQRRTVEESFKKGKIKVIVATPTLASGINLPARRVIVRDVTRFDVNLGFTPIPVLEIQQMCGRAGRPRYDPYGEAILMAKREEDVDYFIEDYLLSPPEPVESKLGTEPALRVHLLAVIATGHCRTVDEVYGFLGQTFFAFERDVHDLESKVEHVLGFLDREKFIDRGKDNDLRATFFGRRTSDLYIDPLSAVKMRDALQGDHDTTFFWLWAACATPDMPKLYLRRGDSAWIEEKIADAAFTFEVEDYDFFLAEIKTASLLEDWIEERTEEEVTKRFGIGPGDIRRMVDQGEWLVYAMGELAKIFRRERVKPLAKLIPRMAKGIKEELLPLTQIRGVGRVRARALFAAKYTNLRELQKASAGDLARIPTIGPNLAISIKEQLGKGIKPQELAGQTALSEFGA